MSAPDGRARLAEQQAALVRALTGRGDPPAHFDAERLRLAASSLASKRRQEAARAWPALARCLGERFRERFDDFAAQTPLPAQGGPLADGRAFVQTLAAGEWTDDVRLEVLAVDLRRGARLRIAWLRQARRLMIGGRLPWLGTWAWAVPLGRGQRPGSADR